MKKYNSIDFIKLIMSICVVAIHTHPITREEHNIYDLIISSAVPFFYLSSGFLLQNKIIKTDNSLLVLKETIKNFLRLYIIWSIIYFPLNMYNLFAIESSYNSIQRIIICFSKYLTMGERFLFVAYVVFAWNHICIMFIIFLI